MSEININDHELLEQQKKKIQEENTLKAKISEYYSFDKGLFKIHINDKAR